MLPFNESCFRVLHSVMVKKKKSNPQLSLYTASLIGFRTTCLLSTGEQKGRDPKEQPSWHRRGCTPAPVPQNKAVCAK